MKIAIVGSGVAGSLMAWQLTQAGHEVIILEAGPRVIRERAVERFRKSVEGDIHSPYPDSTWAPSPRIGDWESHLRQEGPELFMGVYQRLVGGTTWHWLGTALRLLPEDFRMNSNFGVGKDWPIIYDELEHWYGKAESALGVSGNSAADLGSPRSAPYPMPAIRSALVDGEINKCLGGKMEPALPLPQARNSVSYQGRPPCCGSASCIPICPIGAKYDATVHLKLALEKGASLLSESVVTQLEADSSNKISSLQYRSKEGSLHRLEADLFILAAHAVETPRLLLLSDLANSSDQVGRNLMGASAQLSWCLAPEPVYPYRAPQATSGFLQHRKGKERKERAGFLCSIATDGWPQFPPGKVASMLVRRGLKGNALRLAVENHVSRQIALVSTVEELPDPENRIVLAPDWLDAAGIPRPAVRYRQSDYTAAGVKAARQFHQNIFDLMDGEEQAHALATDPAYLLGTTRMGLDPENSVVDEQLRCHDHPNLYLVGSGVFPTSGTAPPTLTVAALALRAAAHITLQGQSSLPASS